VFLTHDELRARASETILERLTWSVATRDQPGIAQSLADGDDISEIYGLGEATVVDEFFYFLDELEIPELFPALDPHRTQRRSNVNFHATLLIYLLRVVAGLSFFSHIGPVLLCSLSLMRLVGFNAREVREGTCARGPKHSSDHSLSAAAPQDPAVDTATDEMRGPYCPESVASSMAALTGAALERFFNAVIRILAAHRYFPRRTHALLDATDIESTERCVGRGRVRKEKAPELRARKERVPKLWVTVFGFKLWAVWDPNSRIPLAVRFATIEVPDIALAQEVVAQAIDNLGEHAQIVSLAFDRGFIDGAFLWWIDQQGMTFYVPAKTDMHVYQDALSLVAAGAGVTQTRERERTVGHGRNRSTVIDRWEVVGLSQLTSAGFYGPLGSGSHEHRKDFVPHPINAVVVRHDPYREKHPNADTLVLLTNGSTEKPLTTYDGYDARSEIENGLFREAKQGWFLKRPPTNTLEGFRAHAYLTLIGMALTTAYRAWMLAQEKLTSQGADTGIRKFRERIRQQNANRVIIFHEHRYAIFEAYEIPILLGRRVLKPRGIPETITRDDILEKYGVQRE
jgi:hypothetical protein